VPDEIGHDRDDEAKVYKACPANEDGMESVCDGSMSKVLQMSLNRMDANDQVIVVD
jgi:hypothetical protein